MNEWNGHERRTPMHLACLHEDRWGRLETSVNHTADALAHNANALDAIKKRLDEIHSKLFVGNGVPAITVRLDRVERDNGRVEKIASAVLIALILGVGTMLANLVLGK